MDHRPPRSPRTNTLFPSPTLFRSPLYLPGGPIPDKGEGAFRSSGHDRSLPQPHGLSDLRAQTQMHTRQDQARETLGTRGGARQDAGQARPNARQEEHTSELQSLMRNSYAVF